VRRSISLTLLIAGCLWFALRDLASIPFAADVDWQDAAVLYPLGPETAIETLTGTIEQQEAEGQHAALRARAYSRRGSYRLLQHEPQLALADFDEALRLDPGESMARFGRAEAYRQLGDPVRANAEIQQTDVLELTDAFPRITRFAGSVGGMIDVLSTSVGVWLLVAAAWTLLIGLNFAVGWGAMKEAAGSIWRLAYVAAGLGLLVILPLGVWAAFATGARSAEVHLWLAAGATMFGVVAATSMLRPPIHLRGTTQKLPRVNDQAFLNRVAELARQMDVPVPLIRLWPSITGSQQALAFAGTLQAPQLAVTDGILQRLSAAERDAVVAHELGHIANGSLWLHAAVIPVGCAAATAVGGFLPLSVAVPFGVALCVGLRRLVSRPLELDADRRAARVIGFRETAGALAKIHAVHSLGRSGLLPLLVYATATHPSPEVRLWVLQTAAPADDVPRQTVPAATIRRHRIATAVAFALWLLVVVGTPVLAVCTPQVPYPGIPLVVVGLAPAALLRLGQFRQISIAKRRMGQSRLRTAVVVAAVLACPVLTFFPDVVQWMMTPAASPEISQFFLLIPFLTAGICLLGSLWYKRFQDIRQLRGEVAVAMHVHDFRRILDIGRSAPSVVARDPLLRYNIAFSQAVCGDVPAAIAELEQLRRERPGFPIAAITLSVLLLDADQPERALEIARDVARRLPDDALTHVLVARAARRLGRIDEARNASKQALAVEESSGAAHAVAAAVALDEGDTEHARQHIEKALELAPGEVYLLLVRAEIALQTESSENARAAIEGAVAAVRTNPLAFYHTDVMRLEQAVAESESSSPSMETAAAHR
jgi:Zn-dependent protease with chaperone function/Tfp pilus assembly protein PilF